MGFKPLPIGIENFGKLIRDGYYYVDKTWLIKELLDLKGEVNLFTRPRRFGKSLSMSMLQYYFEDTGNDEQNEENSALFEGFRIMDAGESYLSKRHAYPVISLSLKSGKQQNFELCYSCVREELAREYRRHEAVIPALPEADAEKYRAIMERKASFEDYITALRFLSDCLFYAYKKTVIILVDEYDVPLEASWFAGYYNEFVGFLRSLFESALKTNPHLEFAVMTGCLRISKESIFTGLNNMKTISILTDAYGEHFGFLQSEVDQMLKDYGRLDKRETLKEWYDGYSFGMAEVYNPWSVINYVKALAINPEALPAPYWSNTSSNAIVKDLIEHADSGVRQEIEGLLAGAAIEKPIHENITYEDMYASEDSLWNFLFFTGYLKKTGLHLLEDTRYVSLAIPNREVRYIYNYTVKEWFQEEIRTKDLSALYRALLCGDDEAFQEELSILLMRSISYMDGKEAFYHGFLLGILENLEDYIVISNREGGLGRFDLVLRSTDVKKIPVVIELKVSDTFRGMEAACSRALKQIEEKRYYDWLLEEGYTEVLDYGISFYKKQCLVKVEKVHLREDAYDTGSKRR